jgi:ABC-type sugar transport system substrate-binding protein
MRTLSRGALAVLLSVTGLSTPILASAALSRAQLEDLEHHLWQVRTDYHMYSVMDGNDTYRVALNEAAQQAAEALGDLRANSDSDAERALVADLADQWQRMAADQALPAPGDAEGEATSGDPRRLDDLPAEMASRIDAFEGAAGGDYDDVHGLISELQQLTSSYVAIIAGNNDGGEAEQDRGAFEQAVPAFSDRLKRVQAAHRGDGNLKRTLEQAALKWGFIRSSMLKFGDDAVPFLVYRYTSQMTSSLQQAVELATSEVTKPTIGPPE